MIDAFYADPHFFHAAVIKFTGRPYETVEEMNFDLVKRYNAKVQPHSTVVWVGDCFFREGESDSEDANMKAAALLRGMNGHKILVAGNHDKGLSTMAALGFDLVGYEMIVDIAGRTCRINHFPYKAADPDKQNDKFKHKRPRKLPGEVLLHGHSHRTVPLHDHNQIDVGVDAWGYSPALMSQVRQLVSTIPAE